MSGHNPERIIGDYRGTDDGPMLVCLGGIHGNEPAGVQAIELIIQMLEVEPLGNPDFQFKGCMLGLRGNLQALEQQCRFVERDLNRSLIYERVREILQSEPSTLKAEDWEIYDLVTTFNQKVDECKPRKIIVLDLHTTTAFGGIFVLTSHDPESINIGIEMHAPVITGFEARVHGTTMDYFQTKNFDRKVIPIVFESGQHNEPLSVNRAIAAIINCMRTIGCVGEEDVENRHDHLLLEYSRHLPKVAKLIDRYHVDDNTIFEMLPDYKNFQRVSAGDILAMSDGQPVTADSDGMLLMPKYQEQGHDGFFIIEPLTGY